MKTKLFNIFFIAVLVLSSLYLASCGKNKASVEVSEENKEKLLETYKKQYAELKAKIDALENELREKDGIANKVNLKLIETQPVVQKDFAHFIEVQGNVESDKNVSVAPEMNGIILRINVERGQAVSQGQIIAEIDAEPIRKNISELETRLELAKTMFERQENLWKQQIGSEMQYLQAKNSKESLERSLEGLKAQLKKAYVKAPISGVVDELFVKQGEMANPAVPLARVVNLSEVQIKADVSEAYVPNVRKGDEVVVSFPSLQKEMPVKISNVGQFIEPANRTFKVEMKLANKDGFLKPNTLAVVKIKDFEQKNAIVIPTFLIQQSTNGQEFVFVVRQNDKKNTVAKVLIKTGKSYGGETLVTEGLQAGDILVSKGYSEVIDGEEVNIQKTEAKISMN
ncbi:MAG: efflux RND transporter periplasmic adaptor subunit [Thermoflexibacter sp.]